jgi:threonine synthase
MDIQVSSNFERLLFDLHDRDGAACAATMAGFEASRRLALPDTMRAEASALFASARVHTELMAATIRWAHEHTGQLIDPHTAIGLAAARAQEIDAPMVTLATAHPAKFGAAVEAACGVVPALPARVTGLMDREERYAVLPADLGAIEAFVGARARPRDA